MSGASFALQSTRLHFPHRADYFHRHISDLSALQLHHRRHRRLRHNPLSKRHPKTQDIKTPSSLPRQFNTLLPTRKDRRRPITPPPSLQHTIDLNIKHHIPNSSQHQLTHIKSALLQHHHHLGRKPKEQGKKKKNNGTHQDNHNQKNNEPHFMARSGPSRGEQRSLD